MVIGHAAVGQANATRIGMATEFHIAGYIGGCGATRNAQDNAPTAGKQNGLLSGPTFQGSTFVS